jgi:DNA-directed RNA polymerase III subunit RPC7
VTDLFPPELRSLLEGPNAEDASNKKRKTLKIATTANAVSKIENLMEAQKQRLEERGEDADEDYDDEDEEDDEEKPDAVNEEDNWSAVSSDSEESADDYNAERYFDNGDDDDVDDGDPYENSYE